MSELLQNWLNNEVGLSTNVANFEKDFANGYLFGEVLHKFRQQEDFTQFVNKGTYEAKLANFKRLEPTLKALGIRVNATQSNAMMNGERGAALRLLYQLKMATERLLLACETGGSQKAATAVRAAPGGGGVTKGIRVPREQFDGHERRFFEHRLRATCPNAKQDRINKAMQPFHQELNKQEAVAFHMDSLEQAHIAEQRDVHRFGLRERLRQNKVAKEEWTRSSIDLWEQNMQKRATCESFDVIFANRTQQKKLGKLEHARVVASSEIREGIETFEGGLAGLGLSRSREQRPSAGNGDSDSEESVDSELHADRLLAATTPAANARELVVALQARMPNAEELEQEAGLFLQKIKESKRAGSIAREERERRRRRVLVEQQREQDLLEESKLEEVLLQKLGRESVEEKAISYSVWKTQKYEDVVVRNRQLRQQGYASRRKHDQQEALRRDQDLREEMIATMREQEERERVRYRAMERGRRARQRAQVAEDCEGLLDLVSGMAVAAVQQEQLTDKTEVDSTLWREWAALFVESKSVTLQHSLEDHAKSVNPPTTSAPSEHSMEKISFLAESQETAEILNSTTLRDYVDGAGQWEHRTLPRGADSRVPAIAFDPMDECRRVFDEVTKLELSFRDRLERRVDAVDGRPVNYRFGAIVAAILDRMHAQPPLPEPPRMPRVPVRLVISGKPFTGKKTIARRLAEAYNLHVIDVEEIVHECLMLSKRPDVSTEPIHVLSFTVDTRDEHCQNHEDAGNPYVRQLQEIGYRLQEVLDRGEAISNELYVDMIITKIRSLFPESMAEQDALVNGLSSSGRRLEDGLGPIDEDVVGYADASSADQNAIEGMSMDKTKLANSDVAGQQGAGIFEVKDPFKASGWVLIGYPDNAHSFQLVERFLSGWVEPGASPTPEAEVQKAKATLLAFAAPKDAPPFEPAPGGYDLHVRLEVRGDEVLRRALGWRLDTGTSLTYHLEDHPPHSKHQVIYERLVPVDNSKTAIGSLSSRIHEFDIAQPEMDFMLSYFGPFPDHPRLACIDAGKALDEVYDALDELVAVLLQRKSAQQAQEEAERKVAEEAAAALAVAAEDEMQGDTEASGEGSDAAAAAVAAAPRAEPADALKRDSIVGGSTAELVELVPVQLVDLPKHVEALAEEPFKKLAAEWHSLQQDFMTSTKDLFWWRRAHSADFRSGLNSIGRCLAEFVHRPDDKQSLVDTFVKRFNAFSEEYPEMRKQDKTKEELHQRVSDLEEQLRLQVDKHRTESLAHIEAAEKNGWVEAQVDVAAAQVQHAIHLEQRRYHSVCQLLSDFYSVVLGRGFPPPKERPQPVSLFAPELPEKEVIPEPKGRPKPPAKGKKEEEPKPEEPAEKGSKKRRYVEAKKSEHSGEVVPGYWEFPFLQDATAQARRAAWALEEYIPPQEEKPEPEEEKAKPAAKAKGRMSPPPDKKKEEVPVVPPTPAPPLFVDLQQALVAERVIYMQRLTMIHNWTHQRLEAISIRTSEAFENCRRLALLRQMKELENVEGLTCMLRDHIESKPPALVGPQVVLEGAHLHRHHSVRLRVEPASPFRWTVWQLEHLCQALLAALRGLEPAQLCLPAASLLSILERFSHEQSGEPLGKDPLPVPSSWRPCNTDRLRSLCSLFEHRPTNGMIDCVDFLLHMGWLHSPLGWPSLDDLLHIRECLEPLVPMGVSWPDFWITPEELAALPLARDPNGRETEFFEKYATTAAQRLQPFDRAREQVLWVGRVLQAFPTKLQQTQSWDLDVAWHDYQVRMAKDAQRAVDSVDVTGSPSPAVSSSSKVVGGIPVRFLPPRPLPPTGLPECPSGAISVRQLLAYFCLGASPEEGIARAFAVLGPVAGGGVTIPMSAVHAILLQLGARPSTAMVDVDGRPLLPSLIRLCDQLGVTASGSIAAADLTNNVSVQRVIAKLGIGYRHCRAHVEKVYPRGREDGKPKNAEPP